MQLNLPPPRVESWDWQLHAECRSSSADMFFPPENEDRASRARRETEAKQYCGACKVRSECADYVVNSGEVHGIWGGLAESDRRPAIVIEDSPRNMSSEEVVHDSAETRRSVPLTITARARPPGRRQGNPKSGHAGRGGELVVERSIKRGSTTVLPMV